VRRYFDRHQIDYTWIDIDKDQTGEAFVLKTNHGMRSVPTIVFSDSLILVEPSERELDAKFGVPSR
jgi:glutaredoxin